MVAFTLVVEKTFEIPTKIEMIDKKIDKMGLRSNTSTTLT